MAVDWTIEGVESTLGAVESPLEGVELPLEAVELGREVGRLRIYRVNGESFRLSEERKSESDTHGFLLGVLQLC